jgi:hypothetical protein
MGCSPVMGSDSADHVVVVVQAVLVPLLADDAVADLGGGPADRAEQKALAVEATARGRDRAGESDPVAGVGRDEGVGDGVGSGELEEVGGIAGLQAPARPNGRGLYPGA